MLLRKITPGSTSRLTTVDHTETYGRHILDKISRNNSFNKCLDIGCGAGTDLSTVKRHNPDAELFGTDFGDWNLEKLKTLGISLNTVDIEREQLPFDDSSIDLIIANQVLEHTKEVFWINHEIFRCLRIGGLFFFGVPNILSLHNRILGCLGEHPTQHKLYSAHVRPFSKKDVYRFYKIIASDFCEIIGFWGSQFYPFPRVISRPLSLFFPSLSFSIFFLLKKTNQMEKQFISYPERASLETNFFAGPS